MRLVGGDSRSGRVEFFLGRFWGTICSKSWSTLSSTVVCRQMGLGNTGVLRSYGRGSPANPVFFKNVRCNGSEPNILACPRTRIDEHDCSHDLDVGVICSELYS